MGLAVAVANLDAIIELIRRAPDPQTAKEQLIARPWPAESVIELIKLIDDPANLEEVARAYQLSEAQAKAILDLRLQRLTGLERDKIAGELREMAVKITYNLEILDSRPKRLDLLRTELHRDEGEVRLAAPDRDPGPGVRGRHRGADPARGHGRHRHPWRLHQARAALDLSRPAARRARAHRHGDARRGFRQPGVRRGHPDADAVLLDPRHGLQVQGLPPAARQSAGARQGADQPAAAGGGRDDLHRHALAGGREQLGAEPDRVRDRRAATSAATSSAISST